MKTQSNETPLTQADEIEALLPWFVTGKLDRAEAERVSRYLAAHPEVAAHAGLAREERDGAIGGNETIAGPSPAALDRLLAKVAATPQPRAFAVPSPVGVWEKIAGFMSSFAPNTLGMAGAAAALLLVLQAVTIGALVTRDGGGGYQTASGGSSVQSDGIQALVMVQPAVTAAALTAALRDLKATVVAGPTADGLYRLKLAGDKADADAAVARLKARADVFAFVGPAPR